VTLRIVLDLYTGIRPARRLDVVPVPLATDTQVISQRGTERVRRPERYDVLVTENLLDHILSDLAAPGCSTPWAALPQPTWATGARCSSRITGPPPDSAGRGITNPLAATPSRVMLFDDLADTHDDPSPRAAARRIEAEVAGSLAASEAQTADLGGRATTAETTRAILRRIA
jgi:isocitrate/isopropylmalate dehydrogenase